MRDAHGELVTAASTPLLWQVKHAKERIWLASPYLSLAAANRLIEEALSGTTERRLLTKVSEASVRAGVLSAKALLKLRESGFALKTIENLHAKLSIVDSWGLVGSANLTASGLGLGGEGAGDPNLELGVELAPAQRRGAEAIFERWWRRADPVSDAELERLASLPVKRPPARTAPLGPSLPLSGAEELEAILAEDPVTAAERRYWIKANYHQHDDEDWWRRGWISDWRRASYGVGDLIFLYLSAHEGGPARCPALVRAMSPAEEDNDFVLAQGDVDAVDHWPFVTRTLRIAQALPATEGIELEPMGKTAASLQNGYCEISRPQFEVGAAALLAKLP